MSRASAWILLVLTLAGGACHRHPTNTPASSAARFDELVERLAALDAEPSPYACAELDEGFSALAGTGQELAARYARAELALRCGDPGAWLAHHQSLARAGYPPSLGRLLDDAIALRDWDRAAALLGRLAPELPDQVGAELEAQLLHARWVDRGEPEDFLELERAAKQAIVRAPKDLDVRADLIRLYVEQAAITEGPEPLLLAQLTEREARRVAAELGTASPRLELVAGFVRELEGRRPAAIAAWERALELNAALVEPCLWLGLAAIERHDYQLAQAQLQRFVDVHPEHVDALLALGVAARRAGDRELAEQAYARAAQLDPDDPRPHWNRAIMWETSEDFAEQLSHFGQALAEFDAIYRRVGATPCPARGEAGPDAGCVAAAEALEHTVEVEYPQRIELVDALSSIPICTGEFGQADRIRELEARERQLGQERMQRLRALEEQLDVRPEDVKPRR